MDVLAQSVSLIKIALVLLVSGSLEVEAQHEGFSMLLFGLLARASNPVEELCWIWETVLLWPLLSLSVAGICEFRHS